MNREQIIHVLPGHRTRFTVIQAERIYVRDYKHHDLCAGNSVNRGVVVESISDPDWDSVIIYNAIPDTLVVEADTFTENALPEDEAGKYASQCECVLFPANGNEGDWILFIETKYTPSDETAQDQGINYPGKMFGQIKSTVIYFRRKGIIPPDKKVHAIMSFPKLLEPFDSWVFPIMVVSEENGKPERLSIEDILLKYKIHLRSTNQALIKSNKRIKLGGEAI